MGNDVQQCREAGKKGGHRVAQLYGQAFREKRAQLGGQSLLLRYGKDYMRQLVLRRYKNERQDGR